ncbi:MAG: bifunctional diguanylate cyclase/phosphodiesterase [Bacillota bacterium]
MPNTISTEQQNKINQIIVDSQDIHIHIIDQKTYEILYYNDRMKKVFKDIEIGKPFEVLNEVHRSLEATKGFGTSLCVLDNVTGGENSWVVRYAPIDWAGENDAFVIYGRRTEVDAGEHSDMDLLTGVSTFTHFKEQFDGILKKATEDYCMFIFDIDKFAYINDTWGYDVGDRILQKMAKLLHGYIKEEELICRMGEDRFAMLLKYKGEAALERIIEAVDFILENLQKQYFSEIKISVMTGIYILEDKDDLFNNVVNKANIARKSIKGSHKNTFKIYTPELEKKVLQEKMIEERMISALENNEFVPYLQPKFNLHTKKICGAEALVRWQAYDRMIYPDEFIPVFEKNGFITVLDFAIYEKVIQYLGDCLQKGITTHPISLNASREHIKDSDFVSKLFGLLAKYDVPLSLIEIEVTEGIFVEDKILLNNFICALREQGVQVSVDDFGTAYSSLNILKDVEIDVIKIDKGFLHNIDLSSDNNESMKDKVVIKHIVAMAKELNFSIVCEGVETVEQVEFLKGIGVEIGQGYVFARPMTIQEFQEKFLLY